jgi:hypothetical protein
MGCMPTKTRFKVVDVDDVDNWKQVYYVNRKGKRDGKYIKYFPNGKPFIEEEFKKGVRDGLRIRYYDNGQKRHEVTLKKENPEGRYVMWWNNGNKRGECVYKGDTTIGHIKEWDSNGRLYEWSFRLISGQYIDIKRSFKSWKTLTKLIENKKKRRIIRRIVEKKHMIYNIQGDNTIFVLIMEYISYEETYLIYRKLKCK